MNLEKEYNQYKTEKHAIACHHFQPRFKVKMPKTFSITGTTTINTITSPILMENSKNIGMVRQSNAEC